MTDLRQAAQQALEALENIDKAMPFPVGKQAITALREALAQDKLRGLENLMEESITALKAALEQPEQQAEPCVGKDPRCPCQDGDVCHYKDCGGTKALPVPVAQPEQKYIPPPPIGTLEDAYVKHHHKYGDRFNAFYTQIPLWMKELYWYAFWKERNT